MKERTNEELIKHYRFQFIICKILTYVLLVAPTIILVAIKFNYYFPLNTEQDKFNISISAVILFICLILAVIKAVKHIESKEVSFIFTSLYFFAGAGITYFLQNVFKDTTLILITVGVGLFLCAVMNMLSQNRKKLLDWTIQGNINASTFHNEKKIKKKKVNNEEANIEVVE